MLAGSRPSRFSSLTMSSLISVLREAASMGPPLVSQQAQEGTCSQGSNVTTRGVFGSGGRWGSGGGGGGGEGATLWNGRPWAESDWPNVTVTLAQASTQGATAAATRPIRRSRPAMVE